MSLPPLKKAAAVSLTSLPSLSLLPTIEVPIIQVYKYNHITELEQGGRRTSKALGAYYLIGMQDFQPDLYCLALPNKLLYTNSYATALDNQSKDGYTITSQYFGAPGIGFHENYDYDFRCCNAYTYEACQLLGTREAWEEYYNTTIRCRKGEEPVLPRVDWSKQSVVALHARLAVSKKHNMLKMLMEEYLTRGESSDLRYEVFVQKLERRSSTLTITWSTKESVRGSDLILVLLIPGDITRVVSQHTSCT